MKNILVTLLAGFCILTSGCTKAQTQTSASLLSPVDFSEKLKQMPEAQLVDVRTPEEYSEGHISKAKNFNWEGDDFNAQITRLDKSLPVFVYCQGGVRSSSAYKKLRAEGFKVVYDLDGGLSNWQDANLPVTKE